MKIQQLTYNVGAFFVSKDCLISEISIWIVSLKDDFQRDLYGPKSSFEGLVSEISIRIGNLKDNL